MEDSQLQHTGIMEVLGEIHKNIAVLDNKLDNLKESNDKEHLAIDTHLTNLNGQVVKNTKFRWQVIAYVPVASVFLSAIISFLFYKFY